MTTKVIDYQMELKDTQLNAMMVKLNPFQFNEMLSDALNETGREIEQGAKQEIAHQNGMTIASAERFLTPKYATPTNLVYELQISYGGIETEKNSKPLPQRGFPGREVREIQDESIMVNLITMQDGKVCPICVMIEKENPYTMEEFNRLRDVHPHLLNKALRCRCSLVPLKPQGREPARGEKAHIDIHTAQQDLVQNIRAKTAKLIRERMNK